MVPDARGIWDFCGSYLTISYLYLSHELYRHSSAPCGTAVGRRIRESDGPEIEIQEYLACPRRIVACIPGLRRRKTSEASILLGVPERAWAAIYRLSRREHVDDYREQNLPSYVKPDPRPSTVLETQ